MGEKKPFHRGERVFVRIKSPAGLITEQEARVKEMAGSRDVAVVVHGNDRIVKVIDVRKASAPSPIDWLTAPIRSEQIKNSFIKHAPRGLSATLGESIMAKTPPSEFQGIPLDTRLFCMMLRGARNARTISRNLMADLLRIKPLELDALETGEDLPDDDLVQRLADVLDLPLDQLIEANERSKAGKEAAREEERKRLEESAKKLADASEAKRKAESAAAAAKASAQRVKVAETPQAARAAAELPRRTLEDFSERLMDVVPLPLDKDRRRQWYTCARILFEIERAN